MTDSKGSAHRAAVRAGDRWYLAADGALVWDVQADARLPHADHIEMSGREVSVVVHFAVDERRRLTLTKECIWPALRIDPDDVRGYLREVIGPEFEPAFVLAGRSRRPGPVDRIVFDGCLHIVYADTGRGEASRVISPDLDVPSVSDRWPAPGSIDAPQGCEMSSRQRRRAVPGMYGTYNVGTDTYLIDSHYPASTYTAARCWPEPPAWRGRAKVKVARSREQLVGHTAGNLVLRTPEPVLDAAFRYAKLRAAESVFATKRGLMHSPGGGRYYGGVWANDQAEYAGPFFPFLGEAASVEASLNCLRLFAEHMGPDYENIPSSLEMEGDIPFHAGGDRGDAAMVAYGAARFALANGDPGVGRELWPAIQWCLEYCRRKTNAAGVVESDTDELEGRFPTGSANLSTSALTYGGLRSGAHLARELGETSLAADYDGRADALRAAIERYFGADMGGFQTYRYYVGNTLLRSWVCLPLAMGIAERAAGTVDALYSPRLWTPDGLATKEGGRVFWDRATLYALRGALTVGERVDETTQRLVAYARRRLLGDHVPYPVEAWPEGDQAHLSAESALLCRVVTEGLFGIEPIGFRAFTVTPRLPSGWPEMALARIRAFGSGRYPFTLTVRASDGEGTVVRLTRRGNATVERELERGATARFELPDE